MVEGESALEELQAANEELDPRREELQTMNEELVSVNQEQARSMERPQRLDADVENLMASSDIGTLFLGRELRVQRYTSQLQTLFHLRAADLGRPLAHVSHQLRYPELIADAQRLLTTPRPIEREVAHVDGRWFLVRLRPYRENRGTIGGVVLTFLDISERRLAEDALRQAHADLERQVQMRTAALVKTHAARKALLRELVQAQERERLRIARDLHDQFGQQITAILLSLRAAQHELAAANPAAAHIESARATVQSMGKEIHQIASDLRPTALDDVGLAEALQSYSERWAQRTGVPVAFFETGISECALPEGFETIIYRVALEALTNIARHAEARQVSLVLERHHGTLILMVEDDGRGFDVEATLQSVRQHEHMGLLGMQERVALIEGTLTVESAPGSGTTLIVRIPLDSSEGWSDANTTDSAG